MTIVVGIDGSSESLAALQWAVDEGRKTATDVTAVMAWNWLDQADIGEPGFSPRYDEADARRALDEAIDEAGIDAGDVARTVICDLAVSALHDASVGAELLVMGARGKGGFAGLRLGSVSERLLEIARLPGGDHPGGRDRVTTGRWSLASTARRRPPPRSTGRSGWQSGAATRSTSSTPGRSRRPPHLPFVGTPDVAVFEQAARRARRGSGGAGPTSRCPGDDPRGRRWHRRRTARSIARVPSSLRSVHAAAVASSGRCSVQSVVRSCTTRQCPVVVVRS